MNILIEWTLDFPIYCLFFIYFFIYFLFFGSFWNSCGCSTEKFKTLPQETIFFYPLAGTELGSQPSLTACDRELVSVLGVRIENGDLNLRRLTLQSVTLPTLPQAGIEIMQFYVAMEICIVIH